MLKKENCKIRLPPLLILLSLFINDPPLGGRTNVTKNVLVFLVDFLKEHLITDNHNTEEGPKRSDLLAVTDRSLLLTDQKL